MEKNQYNKEGFREGYWEFFSTMGRIYLKEFHLI